MWLGSRLQVQVGDNSNFANAYLETGHLFYNDETAQFGSTLNFREIVIGSFDFPLTCFDMGNVVKRKKMNVSTIACGNNPGDWPCYQDGARTHYALYSPTGAEETEENYWDNQAQFVLRVKKVGTVLTFYKTNAYPGGQWEELGTQTINCVGNYETDANYIGIRVAGAVGFDLEPAAGATCDIDMAGDLSYVFPADNGYSDQEHEVWSEHTYPNSAGAAIPIRSLFSGAGYQLNSIIVNP
jgi:hypothetical protein